MAMPAFLTEMLYGPYFPGTASLPVPPTKPQHEHPFSPLELTLTYTALRPKVQNLSSQDNSSPEIPLPLFLREPTALGRPCGTRWGPVDWMGITLLLAVVGELPHCTSSITHRQGKKRSGRAGCHRAHMTPHSAHLSAVPVGLGCRLVT